MRNILMNAEAQYPGSNIDVFIPDLKMKELQKMVNFLYTGVVYSSDTPKLMSNLIHIFGFSTNMAMNVTITCNICHDQDNGAKKEGYSCKSCDLAAQNLINVINEKVLILSN